MSKRIVNVSIVAANYNNGDFLVEFIDSILQSTVVPKEIIIVDDGSTDDSLAVLNKYAYVENLVIVKFGDNQGLCHALNAGVSIATGKYILRVDPDDILMKHRIEKQYDFLELNNGIDVFASNAVYFNSVTGNDLLMTNFPLSHEKIEAAYRKGEHGVLQGTTMIRADAFKKFEYLQENVKLEDFDIFSRMILAGHRFAAIQEPLLKVRIHVSSLSNNISYDTIKRVFQIRDNLFDSHTSLLKVRSYYYYIYYYRKFLISEKGLLKYFYLLLAVMAYPNKLIKKLNSQFSR